MSNEPGLISFQKIGAQEIGYISIAQSFDNVPFEVKRIYWVYNTPEDIERGNHAHKKSEQIIISLKGCIEVVLENTDKKEFLFRLDDPNVGLYIPPMHWRKVRIIENGVFLCLASSSFDESDYIRNYSDF